VGGTMNVKEVGTILHEAAKSWMADHAPRMAAALAFYTILSMAPLLVITTAIVGFVLGEEAAQGQIVAQLQGLIGSAGAEVIQTALNHANQPRAGMIASLLGIVTLLFGASGVFVELQDDLHVVWKATKGTGASWWETVKDRLLSFAMVLSVGFILLVSLILSALLAIIGAVIKDFMPGLGVLVQVVNVVISLGVTTTLFALIFRYVPEYRLPWRVVLAGAALTAAFFSLGKFLIGLYVGQAGIATPFGAAGSVVVLVVWVYYSALIFFFGAEVTQGIAKKGALSSRPVDSSINDEDRYRYQLGVPPRAL